MSARNSLNVCSNQKRSLSTAANENATHTDALTLNTRLTVSVAVEQK
jgi:hypothetical protein